MFSFPCRKSRTAFAPCAKYVGYQYAAQLAHAKYYYAWLVGGCGESCCQNCNVCSQLLTYLLLLPDATSATPRIHTQPAKHASKKVGSRSEQGEFTRERRRE